MVEEHDVHPPYLSNEEKHLLFRDGYVVIKNCIPKRLTNPAKEVIYGNLDNKGFANNNDPRTLALYNDSNLLKIVEEAMGRHTKPITSFVAVTKPGIVDAVVGGKFNKSEILPCPVCHVDGGWAGIPPQIEPQEGYPPTRTKTPLPTAAEIIAAGHELETYGKDGPPTSMGPAGGAPLFQDPGKTLAIGSFTAFVGVCLNDQTKPGKGQFAVRRGAHEAVEAFFRMQRDAGGVMGGGGPKWPRLKVLKGPSSKYASAGLMPDAMKETYPKTTFQMDGWPSSWEQITPLLMEEGDAFIALHSLPHTATPNMSDDPRVNVYWRVRRWRSENPHEGNRKIAWGVSDHPDRAMNGQFLEYNLDEYNPYEYSKEKLCDHWSEWDGMQDIVAEGRANITTGEVRYLNSIWKDAEETPVVNGASRHKYTTKLKVPIKNARSLVNKQDLTFDLETKGHTLVDNFYSEIKDYRNNKDVRKIFYEEVADQIIKPLTNCGKYTYITINNMISSNNQTFFSYNIIHYDSCIYIVYKSTVDWFVMEHLVRKAGAGFNEAFSAYVHSDFHFNPKRHFGYNMLKRNLPEKYGQYTIQELHEKFDLAYVNIWKPIVGKNSDGQIYGNHLCIIDSRTIDESDLVKYQYDGGNGRGGIALMPVFNPKQEWFYYHNMRSSEVLVTKQHDTRKTKFRNLYNRSKYCPHTSFYNSKSTNRESIEVRYGCVFPKEKEIVTSKL